MNEMAVVQARTILTPFQTKLSSFKIGTQFFKIFLQLVLEKDGSIFDSDLKIYAKHLKNFSEDFEGTL